TALYPTTVAIEESASIACARVLRGINSTANVVSFSPMAGSSAVGSSSGRRNPSTTDPGRIAAMYEGLGRCTHTSTSAAGSNCVRSVVTFAPAASYSRSLIPAASPAAASIHTSFLAAASFFTDSGTRATRASPGRVSRKTATRIGQHLPCVLLRQCSEFESLGGRGGIIGELGTRQS